MIRADADLISACENINTEIECNICSVLSVIHEVVELHGCATTVSYNL